jgi:predicted alpha/beta superfamily hydrolase
MFSLLLRNYLLPTTIIVAMLVSFNSFSANSDLPPEFNEATFTTDALPQGITVNTYVPDDYAENPFPTDVIYILDGQRLFYHYVSLQQSFQQFRLTPPFIVVGINTPYPKRFGNFEQFTNLYQLINSQVVPYIKNTYKTNNRQIIAGWEYAGAFAFRTLLENDSPFDAAIASSPFPMQNQSAEEFLKLPSNKQNEKLEKFLFVATGDHAENSVLEQVSEFFSKVSLLDNATQSNWTLKKWTNESHRSSFNDTFYYGTLAYYKGYRAMPLSSIDDFHKQGGFKSVEKYYIDRENRFGVNPKILNETRWQIARYAMDENNIEVFEQVFLRSSDTSFESDLSDNWKLTFANYFSINGNFAAAKRLLLPLSKKYPENTKIRDKLREITRHL